MKWYKASVVIDRVHKRTFRSLHMRNYRLYFTAQVISTSGTWVQLVAENWLVVRLGGSGLMLGITTALQFIPLLLFSTYGGVLVDRWNKRSLLIFTQSASGILALSIGLLALTGFVQIWMIWITAFLLGCVNALDTPGRQVFTMELVGAANVTNAVALNNAVSTSARAIGPAIGGLLIASAGIVPCFLINAVSYGVVVIALCMMDSSKLYTESQASRRRGQVREGLHYVWRNSTLRTVLLIMLFASTFGFNFQVLFPLLVSHTFHDGGALYGLLMSCLGVGSLIGSLVVASWNDPMVSRVAALSLVFGVTLAAVAFAPNLPSSFLAIGVMGIASSLFLASCSGCLQVNTVQSMRGRVMALYSVAFLGTAPIGGPIVGWLAQSLGPRAGFLLGALACITASSIIFLRQRGST